MSLNGSMNLKISKSVFEDTLNRLGVTCRMDFVEETGSTSLDLLEICRTQKVEGIFGRTAMMQTSGRGTRGRAWHSGVGSLLFSVALPYCREVHTLTGIGLAIATTLTESCRQQGIQSVAVKWPNDIWMNEGKLGGILVEPVKAGDDLYLVVGVGINLLKTEGLEKEIGRRAAFLLEEMENQFLPDIRAKWLGLFVFSIITAVEIYQNKGLDSFRERWLSFDAFRGRTVRVLQDDSVVVEGLAQGIDNVGRLIIQTQNGFEYFSSGTVSLRLGNEHTTY